TLAISYHCDRMALAMPARVRARAREAWRVALLGLLWLTCACGSVSAPPTARDGVLDLRGWDFERQPPVALEGQYRGAWTRLLTPGLPSSGEAESAGEQAFERAADRLLPVPGQWRNLPELPSDRLGHGAATYRLEVLLGRASRGLALRLPFPTVALRTW